MKHTVRLITLTCSAFMANNLFACNLAGYHQAKPKTDSPFTLGYQLSSQSLMVDEHFSMLIRLCENEKSVDAKTMRVNATMPAHQHGMNYRPSVTQTSDGQYQVEGMLFHMSGHWQFAFDVFINGRKEQFIADYNL